VIEKQPIPFRMERYPDRRGLFSHCRSRKTVDEHVGLIDVMPTLNTEFISQTFNNASLCSVIKDGWKLILNTTENSRKFFNLEENPKELVIQAMT